MTVRSPSARISASSSTAPGSGFMRSSTGNAIARLMRAMVCTSPARPCRASEVAISTSAAASVAGVSVEMARASSPMRLLSIKSATSASIAAVSSIGIAVATRWCLPAPSVLRKGHEFGHRVPPTSIRAASSAFGTAPIIPSMLRLLTAGESHGPQLTVIIDGIPSGLEISEDDLRRDLARRQGGHGRGGRQKIETDVARIVSGVRGGVTIGSPITLVLENKDHENWTSQMTASKEGYEPKPVTRLRPGLADLAGAMKYGHSAIRNVPEPPSARKLLAHFGIEILSFTQSIGTVDIGYEGVNPETVTTKEIEESPVRCPDPDASAQMVTEIDHVAELGDTIGGTFRVVARGVPPGLGSYVHWDRKLDGRSAQAILSINAIKGVVFGAGFQGAARHGSDFHDQIEYEGGRFHHLTNRAGGLTGGMTNGEPIDLRVAIKPISTMKKPMWSVDLITKEPVEAHYERSDVCVVPAAGVIGEAVVALTLAEAFLEKFGGDSMPELERNYRSYLESIGQ